MNTDSPITHPREDKFGYAPLASQVASVLILDPKSASMVAGVEARWGSGKTSFLNLTRRALENENRNVLIFDYRPWLYSTVDALLLGFCVQIAAQLQGKTGEKYQNASRALIALSGVFSRLASLPGEYGLSAAAGAAGTQLLAGAAEAMKDLRKIDLSNARGKVQAALDNAGRPVVIVIDDVDRLEPTEIRLLFQFLKAVADFRGVSYLLAYDPTPVEKALSFGGELSGREYLKKFIQLPIRLPRISNLLLQRFFREAVDDLSGDLQPPLSKTEKKALHECTQLAVFLQCLKTPRDVVRLLNSFRLRLYDCRDEVNMDQLLLFVLLDLISPEGIEIVRGHPELFLLPLTRHPEFEILHHDAAVSRLLSEEKDKDKERNRLLEKLDEPDAAVAKKLISHLFDTGADSHRDYDVRRAQTADGLIKLLYGGTSSLSFSAKDAVAFLHDVRRTQIINEIVNAGVLRQWLYFLSSITDTTEIKNPIGIAKAMISAVKHEPTNTFESVHRISAEYLFELLQKVSMQKERQKFIDAITGQRQNLYIAEHFLVKLAANAGLWKDGQSFSIENRQTTRGSDLVPLQVILDAEAKWLRNVRAAAANGTLHRQPHVGSLLHRWGQFNDNNYRQVQEYFRVFCESKDPLLILSQFALGVSLDGLDKIVSDPVTTQAALARYQTHQELRATAAKVMINLQNLQEKSNSAEAV